MRKGKAMGDYYRSYPTYTPTPSKPEPTEKEKDILCHYFILREEISRLENLVGDNKNLDKAIILLKVGCKHIKAELRKIGYKGPLKDKAKTNA